MARRAFPLLVFLILTACISTVVPLQEYSIAKSAYDAAVAAEAAKYSPQLFYKAEKAYKKAEKLYKDRDYSAARKEFLVSQKLAEKAETEARIKQFNSGESGEE
jgi:hypothetical protein